MLWRYRRAVGISSETKIGWLTALVGVGYFFVWTVVGLAVFASGVALAAIEMQEPALSRAVPLAIGLVVLVAGALQLSGVESGSPGVLQRGPGPGRRAPGRCGHGVATRRAPRPSLLSSAVPV